MRSAYHNMPTLGFFYVLLWLDLTCCIMYVCQCDTVGACKLCGDVEVTRRLRLAHSGNTVASIRSKCGAHFLIERLIAGFHIFHKDTE